MNKKKGHERIGVVYKNRSETQKRVSKNISGGRSYATVDT